MYTQTKDTTKHGLSSLQTSGIKTVIENDKLFNTFHCLQQLYVLKITIFTS